MKTPLPVYNVSMRSVCVWKVESMQAYIPRKP